MAQACAGEVWRETTRARVFAADNLASIAA